MSNSESVIWGIIVEKTAKTVSGYAVDLSKPDEELDLDLVAAGSVINAELLEDLCYDPEVPPRLPVHSFAFDISSLTVAQKKVAQIQERASKTVLAVMDSASLADGAIYFIGKYDIVCCVVIRDTDIPNIKLHVIHKERLVGVIEAPIETAYAPSAFSFATFQTDISELLEDAAEAELIRIYVPDYDCSLNVVAKKRSQAQSKPSTIVEIPLEIPQQDAVEHIKPKAEIPTPEQDLAVSEPPAGESAEVEPSYQEHVGKRYTAKVCLTSGCVEGAIIYPADEPAPCVSVEEDGAIIWEGTPHRLVPRNLYDDRSRDCRGIRVELPHKNSWWSNRQVIITISGSSGRESFNFTFSSIDQYIGEINSIEKYNDSLVVKGWCINIARPSDAVRVRVRHQGEELACTETVWTQKRASYEGYDSPYADFELRIALDISVGLNDLSFHGDYCLTPLVVSASQTENVVTQVQTSTVEIIAAGADDIIEGTIDEVSPALIRGWARNSSHPTSIPVLDCFIDEIFFATSAPSRFRADLAKKFVDHGYHEYIFELNPAVNQQRPGKIRIVPRMGVNRINHKLDCIPHRLSASRTIQPRKSAFPYLYKKDSTAEQNHDLSITYIIINRNGGKLLESFFETFAQYEVGPFKYEIFVVDHNSKDESEHICDVWSRKINIRMLKRNGNYSFSSSNNYAASFAFSDILVFVNNDVSFFEHTAQEIVSALSDQAIGCVGIRLLDDSPFEKQRTPAAVQHLGVHFREDLVGSLMNPFESRDCHIWHEFANLPAEVPAVTGAFLACRRQEFIDFGGFDEAYFYGMEDVDLCLKYQRYGKKIVSLNHVGAYHLRGFSRAIMDKRFSQARANNRVFLEKQFGYWLRARMSADRFSRPGFWSSCLPRIAFAVTEATSDTLAGDFFTALELAGQLSAIYPCECVFLEYNQKNHYNLADCDVLISMRDDYDVRKISNARPNLIKIAWVRNWFERFAQREWASEFDIVWASSSKACGYISDKLGKNVDIVPIATNWFRFTAGRQTQDYSCDYCFTGSYWGLNREIVQMLRPEALPFDFALFGSGWEAVPHLRSYHRGSLPYKQLPHVYASTRLVIDDANHVTKFWGGVNSRVFDAIAAGCLVLTNSREGSESTFGGALPVYNSPQELEDLIYFYLTNESERVKKVAELSKIVKSKHTYQLRAKYVWKTLQAVHQNIRIAIKICAPNMSVAAAWGDFHYAQSMKKCFEKHGHFVRIDAIDNWYCSAGRSDEVVIVLRGLTAYAPQAHHVNLMWNISHIDKVSMHEFNLYDHVFFASNNATERMCNQLSTSCSTLLQCTDPAVFSLGERDSSVASDILFVGNSRGMFRPVVRAVAEAGLDISVFGGGWEAFVPEHLIKGQLIENRDLGRYYRSANIVLNDHWDNMREYGFLSNRLFDAAACGAVIVSDYVPGIRDVFGSSVYTFDNSAGILDAILKAKSETNETIDQRRNLALEVGKRHTFAARVTVILQKIEELRNGRHPTRSVVAVS